MYDAEEKARYEIEVMLRRVDESHLIRTLEQCDIERKRFPSLQLASFLPANSSELPAGFHIVGKMRHR